MYICRECKEIFETPYEYSEDRTPGGSFEGGSFIYHYDGCPHCSSSFEEAKECDNCCEYISHKDGEYIEKGFFCNRCIEELENEEGE